MVKTATWAGPDTEVRQRGERTGLDTRVVHAVNDGHSPYGGSMPLWGQVNTLSGPPGNYERKLKTQRN